MRYRRQGYEIPVEIDAEIAGSLELETLTARFHAEHAGCTGSCCPGAVEIVMVRSRAIGRTEQVRPRPAA